jgi:hypothetical protein
MERFKTMRSVFILTLLSLILGWSIPGRALAQRKNVVHRKQQTQTLNGVTFLLPKGFVQVFTSADKNGAFFFNKKEKEGLFIAAPNDSFDEAQLLQNLIKDSLTTYFPKEPQTYQWREGSKPIKVSKFEVESGKTEGFNKSNLISIEYRHLVYAKKHIFIGNVFEIASGKEAEERFNGDGETMSMGTCNTAVDVASSITGEKFTFDNTPCALVAIQ